MAKHRDDPSKPGSADHAPMPQHHRMAEGEKVDGKSNPNGGKASTEKKVANAKCTY